MADDDELGFTPDEIGEWSERKIDIVAQYARPYAKIVSKHGLNPIYIDGLSGGGLAKRKTPKDGAPSLFTNSDLGNAEADETLLTTAMRILRDVELKFSRYYFIDANRQKTEAMRARCAVFDAQNVEIICDDVNAAFIKTALPHIRSNRKNRALCFLDPYGMHVTWRLFEAAGRSGQIETFINFPTMDIVRNILRPTPELIPPLHIERMNSLWGDDTWRSVAFKQSPGLFDTISEPISSGEAIAVAFSQRLIDKAGFKFASKPMPFRNSRNGLLYHLIFATQQPVALKIANEVMEKRATPLRRMKNG